jgi:tetratricopeptide (TPR) repeat protein
MLATDHAVRQFLLAYIPNFFNKFSYRNRGLVYWTLGDNQNAIADFYCARKYFPNDADMNGLLGLSLLTLGRMDEAIAAYTRSIELCPFIVEGYTSRGNVYAAMGDYERARFVDIFAQG